MCVLIHMQVLYFTVVDTWAAVKWCAFAKSRSVVFSLPHTQKHTTPHTPSFSLNLALSLSLSHHQHPLPPQALISTRGHQLLYQQ